MLPKKIVSWLCLSNAAGPRVSVGSWFKALVPGLEPRALLAAFILKHETYCLTRSVRATATPVEKQGPVANLYNPGQGSNDGDIDKQL